jgi:hypothetical protein
MLAGETKEISCAPRGAADADVTRFAGTVTATIYT